MTDRISSLYTDHIRIMRERHDRALAASGFDHIVIAAGTLHYQFLDDMAYPFKVNPHFKSWVPVVDNPNCFVVYTPGEQPKLIFWQPVDYWHKTAETPRGFWVEHFDIKMIAKEDQAKEHFPKGRVAYVGEGAENPEALLNRLHFARAWKTEYELECLRRANERGARGHIAAERAFRAGDSEYEIHLAYLRAASHTEEELPYGNIIALNEHGSVLHYYFHEHQKFDGPRLHSFLIDAGGTYNGYAADITRTYSSNDDEFARLIEAMDEMQQALVTAVGPGVNYPDIHMLAHRKVGEILQRFEFVRELDADGMIEKRITSTFLPHGVGHLLGLQVHDVGGFMADESGKEIPKPEGHPYLRLTRVVEPTMVFTIEPGLYFIESLLGDLQKTDGAKYVNWEKVDAFRKFGGIRIEDDIAVTADGRENLTRDAFARVS